MTRYTKFKVERFFMNLLSSHQAMKAIDLNSVVKINSFFSNKCTTILPGNEKLQCFNTFTNKMLNSVE